MAPTRHSLLPPTTSNGLEDESALIRAEMHRIETMSEQPRRVVKYLDLCQRYNYTISAARSLPQETLAIIFQCTLEDCSRFQLTLRLVSTLWNAVVQSSPFLWTNINLGDEFIKKGESYLKLCLHYSRSFSLSISLAFKSYRDPDPPPFYDTLKNNLHRVRSLSLRCPAEKWLRLVPKCRQLVNLSINECNTSAKPPSLSLPNGNLTQIYLALNLRKLHFGSSKTSITHVKLFGVPIDLCVRFLIQCPNLIEFICHCATPPRSKLNILSHIELKHLSTLGWILPNYSGWDDIFPKYIHTPALRSLTWGIDGFSPKWDPRLSAFFSQLTKSLEKVDFRNMGWDEFRSPNPIDYLCRDADIRSINLFHCSRPFAMAFITALKPTGEGASNAIVFPNLTEIYVDNYDGYVDIINPPHHYIVSNMGDILIEILEERKAFLRKFKFDAYTHHFMWSRDIWRRLKKLEDDGLELTILRNQRLVDISSQV